MRGAVNIGDNVLEYVPFEDSLADLLTKNLDGKANNKLDTPMGMYLHV